MKKREIKVIVEYTPGYEERFTEALMKRIVRKRNTAEAAADPAHRKTRKE